MSKRERNAETTRETILDAAEVVFAQLGFSGARVDAIAEASTYNKALIFQYFGDKEGLYREVVHRLRERAGNHLIDVLSPFADIVMDDMNARHFLETYTRAYYDHLLNTPALRAILAWEAAEGWRTFNTIDVSAPEQQFNELLQRLIARAQPYLNPQLHPMLLTLNILSLCLMHLLMMPRFPNLQHNIAKAHALDQIVRLVLDGAVRDHSATATAEA